MLSKFCPTYQFYEFETLGIQAPQYNCPESTMSTEDRKAIELMENSCKQKGERYEIGVSWKKDKGLLPNNYALAERRLFLLENKVRKMVDHVSCQKEEVKAKDKSEYYLPHHGVYRPEKRNTP